MLHRVESRRRRCPQAVLAQEPAQQIASRDCGARAASFDEGTPVEHRCQTRRRRRARPRRRCAASSSASRRLRLVAGGARERSRIAGKRRGETRRDLVAQEISLQRHVGVGLVVDPGEPTRLGVRCDRRVGQREKRAQQRGPERSAAQQRHRGEAVRARAAQKLQQQCLRLVVGMMRERHEIGCDRFEHAIACGAGGGLDPIALRTSHAHAMHGERHARAARIRQRRTPPTRRRSARGHDGRGRRTAMTPCRGTAAARASSSDHRITAAGQGDRRCASACGSPPSAGRREARARASASSIACDTGRTSGRRHRHRQGRNATRRERRARGINPPRAPCTCPTKGSCPPAPRAACRAVCSCAWRSASVSALRSVTMIAAWSRCAPPTGSVMTLSTRPELLQARRRDAERLGRFGGEIRRLPQDRRATLRRDHRVRRVLQHQHHVADRDRERAAGAAFADHRDDDRHAQSGHLVQVAADRLRLAALLGADSRVRAGRVDEREQRQAELLGELHETQRLAIALRSRHAEVAEDFFLGVAPFLVADHHAWLAVEAREAADDGGIVAIRSVAVQLAEIREQAIDVIERVRPLRMPRDLRDLPRRELRIDVLRELLALLLQPR